MCKGCVGLNPFGDFGDLDDDDLGDLGDNDLGDFLDLSIIL
jgi:hypothetical protein